GTADRIVDDGVGRRDAALGDRERPIGRPRLAAAGAGGNSHDKLLVVGVGGGNVGRIAPLIVRVGARGRSSDDGIGNVPVVLVVIDAGHGNGLRRVPIGGGERQTRGRYSTFRRVT